MSRVKLVGKEEVSGKTAEEYAALEKSRGGIVPNLFKALGYNAGMVGPATDVANFVSAASKVPVPVKQIAYLVASRLNGCEYCLVRHGAAAVKAGLAAEKLEAIRNDDDYAANPIFDRREQVIIRVAEELTQTGSLPETAFESLREFFNDEEIVELVFIIASANMFNRIAGALGIELEPVIKK